MAKTVRRRRRHQQRRPPLAKIRPGTQSVLFAQPPRVNATSDREMPACLIYAAFQRLEPSRLKKPAMTEVDHLPRLSPGAQRMRRYRRRREAGQQCITLTLHEYQVWGLVACGFLDKDHRQNREAVADALRAYLSDAMPPIE